MTPPKGPRGGLGARKGGGAPRETEWAQDALVWLVAHAQPPALPSEIADPVAARAQECFWAWLGHETARHEAASDWRVTERAADWIAARLVGPDVETHGVRRIEGRPRVVRPLVRGTVSRVVEAARRARAAPLVELAVAAGAGRALWDEPCEQWVSLSAADPLPDRRYVALRVAGASMEPLLHSGDIVLVDLDGAVIPGAIVVARGAADDGSGGGYMVKRLRRQTDTMLELASLNPAYSPAVIPRDGSHILGTVVMRWCEHRAGRHLRSASP